MDVPTLCTRGHAKAADTTMVSIVHKDMVFSSHVLAAIRYLASIIHIFAWNSGGSGLVEDLAWKWIAIIVCNIVVGKQDDVGLRNPISLCNLVCMTCICLVTIVAISV